MTKRSDHIPERTCVGCRRKGPKWDLVRVSRLPDGRVEVDPDYRLPGRGAYVCYNEDCVLAARKRRALNRTLRTQVPEEVYERLLEYVRQFTCAED